MVKVLAYIADPNGVADLAPAPAPAAVPVPPPARALRPTNPVEATK